MHDVLVCIHNGTLMQVDRYVRYKSVNKIYLVNVTHAKMKYELK